MKRRNFIKAAGALSVVPAMGMAASMKSEKSFSGTKEIYEWRIYMLTGDGDLLDPFLKEVLIPAYNRKHIKTGAFRLYNPKEGEKEQRHILFIYPDIDTYLKVKRTIWEDPVFRQESEEFYKTTAPNPVYSNFESYLSEAFDKIPVHRIPDASRTLFEIRIYHSPNEEANQRKVKMFNKEEIDLFDKVAINSVLYGDILSGPRMPALLYLTWYKDEKTRSEAWDKFRNHPDWKRMSALPEYANTATNNQSIFLSPMPYSQL
jgi:hypothetical protein